MLLLLRLAATKFDQNKGLLTQNGHTLNGQLTTGRSNIAHNWSQLFVRISLLRRLSAGLFILVFHASDSALWTYNNERLNMGIGGITPAQKLKNAA